MHISEGVLSAPVLIAGAAVAAAGVAVGLKQLDEERIPRAALLSAAFFVASLIHVPIGPSSAHLILNGLVGLLLGWAAFPAILVALILQGVLFGFGGITTLGVNTVIMAAPAVICHYLFGRMIHRGQGVALAAAFGCGFLAVLLGGVIVAMALTFTEAAFFEVAAAVVLAHLPVMVIEGLIAAACVAFLRRVQPELLGADGSEAAGTLALREHPAGR
jgi:cobalt/nickel transport system permease protein